MAEITALFGFDPNAWGELTEPQQIGYEQQVHVIRKRNAQYAALELAQIILAVRTL